jgi:hypothetical protein
MFAATSRTAAPAITELTRPPRRGVHNWQRSLILGGALFTGIYMPRHLEAGAVFDPMLANSRSSRSFREELP